MRIFLLVAFLLSGCTDEARTKKWVESEDLTGTSIGSVAGSPVFRLEMKDAVCYSNSRGISCMAKAPK